MTALAVSITRATRSIDRVAFAILAIVAVLALLAPPQALASLRFTAASLLDVAPFLLLSVGVAAYAKASGADNLIARAFTGRLGIMVVFAALMGALSPFCSCGVIPLVAALLAMGVPLPPVMAFWLASPLMDPSMFVLTAGTLGTDFALFKAAAAVGIGLLGGFGTMVLMSAGWFAEPLRAGLGNGGCAGGKIRAPQPGGLAHLARACAARDLHAQRPRQHALPGQVAGARLPARKPHARLGPGRAGRQHGWRRRLAAGARRDPGGRAGVPQRLRRLPLVSGLIGQGMAPGAGMAFLLAGGVTSIPAAIAVYALARPPVFVAYLAFAFLGSLGAGLLFGHVLSCLERPRPTHRKGEFA